MKQTPMVGGQVIRGWICISFLLFAGCGKTQDDGPPMKPGAEKPARLLVDPEDGSKGKRIDPLTEARERSKANLQQIAKAFNKYHEANGHYPIGLIDPKHGLLGLSWRVQILPYLDDPEAAKVFKQFQLNEPWDSEHNKKLLAMMPKVYASVRGQMEEGGTFYQGFADQMLEAKGEKWPKEGPVPFGHPGAFFPDPRILAFPGTEGKPTADGALPDQSRKMVPDGTANTFLVAEAGKPVPWTKPEDIPFRRELKKPEEGICPKLGGLFDGDFQVVTVYGTTYHIKKNVPAEKLRPFITFSGGEREDFFSIGVEPPEWSEIKRFVGTWLRTSFEENGKKQPFDEKKKITIKFNKDFKVVYSENGTVLLEGEFYLLGELTKAAKKARWDWKSDISDRVIYSFEGDNKLVTCWTRDEGKGWPTRFATGSPKDGSYLAVWVKVKE